MSGDWIDKVEYPQLPSMTETELLAFFEEAQFARLGTLNEDGTIHIAPIFFKYFDGQILMATQDTSRKIQNIKQNHQVTGHYAYVNLLADGLGVTLEPFWEGEEPS